MSTKSSRELRIAEEIVSVLPGGSAVRICSDDRKAIRFAVRAGLKLRQIVLNRESLRRLVNDPQAAVKIEYLQRDLKLSAASEAEFRYPHEEVRRVTRRVRAANAKSELSLASAF